MSARHDWSALPPLPAVPSVSVLLAVRNEERHVARALDSVRAQDWPRERMEILVIDGDSGDRTREIVERVAARDPRVKLLRNPGRIVARGLNVGLAAARGEVIARVDGHCRVPEGYVRAAVAVLRSGAAECAGGPVRALGETRIARAIALAMSTPFGVGGASFRWASDEREVDHLPFGVWRREVFEALGGFDAALVRNQDDEFSDRLRRSGGRIRMLPAQRSEYFSRGTLGGLWRQYFGYGYWKVRVIRRRGGVPSSGRHVVPAALVLGLAAGVALAALGRTLLPALVVPGLYAAFLLVATLHVRLSRREHDALLLPLVLPVLHLAYGCGFLAALARAPFAPDESAAVPAVGPLAGSPAAAAAREAA